MNARPTNKYYHSIYDDVINVDFTYANTSKDFTQLAEVNDFKTLKADSLQMKVRNVSSILALALYQTLTGKEYTGTKVANPVLADEFLYCFLQSADCPLFKAASYPGSQLTNLPPMR